jgi:hypothetical protein
MSTHARKGKSMKMQKVVQMNLQPTQEQAHQIAKDFIKPYVRRGDPIEWIATGGMGRCSNEYNAQIGGIAFPGNAPSSSRKRLTSRQIAVTEIAGQPCLFIFSLDTIYKEVKQDSEQPSLWNELQA